GEGSTPVPVLHLHGGVGWYLTDKNTVEFQGADQEFNSTLGKPGLLLPDPNKDPRALFGVNELWREFIDAIESSTHILIIGHSLHDRYLVEQINLHGRSHQIGVTVWDADPNVRQV